MHTEQNSIGLRFWASWVTRTLVGYAFGFLLGFVLAHFVGEVALGVGIGALTGYLQWRALRHHVQRSGRWVWAGIVGLTVGLGLYQLGAYVWGYPLDLGSLRGVLGWAVALGLGGAVTGLLQERVLRRQVARSMWWVPACALGWGLSALGLAIPGGTFGLRPYEMSNVVLKALAGLLLIFRETLLQQAVAGIILGAVSGGVLIWLLRQPTPRGGS